MKIIITFLQILLAALTLFKTNKPVVQKPEAEKEPVPGEGHNLL